MQNKNVAKKTSVSNLKLKTKGFERDFLKSYGTINDFKKNSGFFHKVETKRGEIVFENAGNVKMDETVPEIELCKPFDGDQIKNTKKRKINDDVIIQKRNNCRCDIDKCEIKNYTKKCMKRYIKKYIKKYVKKDGKL